MSNKPILAVDGLTVEFRTDLGWATVVDDVSFTIGSREIVGIVGESGSGKSVTARAIMGVIPKPSGRMTADSIVLGGHELTQIGRRHLEDIRGNEVSMVLQDPLTSLNPAYTVGEQIAETIRRHRRLPRRVAMNEAATALDRVGIPNPSARTRAYPHEFSGGMRQRVAIAMALSCQPSLLICDEPTTALDVTIQAQVLDLIRNLRSEMGMAVMFVTHDLGVVADLCDRVIVMYAGQIVEEAPATDLFYRPAHPYTDGLLRSIPTATEPRHDLYSIQGQPPYAGAMPDGCRFHPRCPYVAEDCRSGTVPHENVASSHVTRCLRAMELTLTTGSAHG